MELVEQHRLEWMVDERHPTDPLVRKMAKEILFHRALIDAHIDSAQEVMDQLILAVQDIDILFDALNHMAHRK